jgi:hypothetical protein
MRTARAVALVAGSVAVLALIWHAAGSRAARRSAAFVGGALVVVALAAPTVHAWYLAWGLALMAAGATANWTWMAVAGSVALCFTSLPAPLQHHPLGILLTLGLLAVAAVSAAPAAMFTRWRIKETVA